MEKNVYWDKTSNSKNVLWKKRIKSTVKNADMDKTWINKKKHWLKKWQMENTSNIYNLF